ncbi:methionine adenosyltransferase domain-containing protein, partial [Patescibacteria group bacterium]|nr:methionine adenosyltransferase domain-containing protein [Patescibacteria group bacterium]
DGGACGTTIMHGYATRETREMLPRVYVYANALAKRIDDLRKTNDEFSWLSPDGKVQLTMDGKRLVSAVVHVQHMEGIDLNHVKKQILDFVINPILGDTSGAQLHVNSAGKFFVGGFEGGTGASGRKVGADTHGGLLPSGGSHLSGRDPLHPARAGRYMARFAAKSLVSEGVADNIFISLAYTMGQASPVFLEAKGGKGEDITQIVKKRFDFRPEAIVERLRLKSPIYRTISTFGQFGRSGLPWEDIEKI